MNSWRKGSLVGNNLTRSTSREGESDKDEEIDLVDKFCAILNDKRKELQSFLEVAKDRKESAMKNIEITKAKINQVW